MYTILYYKNIVHLLGKTKNERIQTNISSVTLLKS